MVEVLLLSPRAHMPTAMVPAIERPKVEQATSAAGSPSLTAWPIDDDDDADALRRRAVSAELELDTLRERLRLLTAAEAAAASPAFSSVPHTPSGTPPAISSEWWTGPTADMWIDGSPPAAAWSPTTEGLLVDPFGLLTAARDAAGTPWQDHATIGMEQLRHVILCHLPGHALCFHSMSISAG